MGIIDVISFVMCNVEYMLDRWIGGEGGGGGGGGEK